MTITLKKNVMLTPVPGISPATISFLLLDANNNAQDKKEVSLES
jgi:hypothetical protein